MQIDFSIDEGLEDNFSKSNQPWNLPLYLQRNYLYTVFPLEAKHFCKNLPDNNFYIKRIHCVSFSMEFQGWTNPHGIPPTFTVQYRISPFPQPIRLFLLCCWDKRADRPWPSACASRIHFPGIADALIADFQSQTSLLIHILMNELSFEARRTFSGAYMRVSLRGIQGLWGV